MPPNPEDNLIDTEEEEEEEIAPAYLSSHEEEVTKLRYNAKENSRITQTRIEELEKKVTKLTDLAEALRAKAEKSQKLYKEHIKHTQALVATGKDPGEILRPRQPDLFNGNADKL
ncbi:hypothetical protein NW756_005518 [Fusarium oxysporum]|nr:hypothetical protein NW753_014592 [Fusarium oxysporum]KAJ4091319.1 hypothetical protein NW756_005518 [Fusarium oxysporum]